MRHHYTITAAAGPFEARGWPTSAAGKGAGQEEDGMAASPRWKVYTADGEYIAACKYVTDAAALVAGRCTTGTTIRDGHRAIVWTDGIDGDADASYDVVMDVVRARGSIAQERGERR